MITNPELIVMLTHNDQTVSDAYEIFDRCKDCRARYWGFKEVGIPLDDMKKLYSYMKACGKTTVLEVVAYTEPECMDGAKTAVECGCDILMGTIFFDSVNEYCKSNNLKYMPFAGSVSDRPSVLKGSIDDIINEAHRNVLKGVCGFDLLAYRYTGDAEFLIKEFVESIDISVCIAGSVNSFERLAYVKKMRPWAFTIGGAFFESKFGNGFAEQINTVCEYMEE